MPGTVVVNQQVVHPQRVGVLPDNVPDVPHGLLRRATAKDGVLRVPQDADAAPENEQCNGNAA